MNVRLPFGCIISFTALLCLSSVSQAEYRESWDRIDKVNAKEAAVLVQSNLYNTGKGLLDFTGPLSSLITNLGGTLRQEILPGISSKEKAALLNRELVQPLEKIQSDLLQIIPDLTNVDLNGTFGVDTTNKFIDQVNLLNKAIHQYQHYFDAATIREFQQFKYDLQQAIYSAKLAAARR